MPGAATPEAVMAAYADLINQHDFSLLVPLIDPEAVFWFSSGSFTGIDAIRGAFERTWQRLENETYWLENLIWIADGDTAASCTSRFCWRAMVDGKDAEGSGRGTTVLIRRAESWRIIHEHLSPYPD